MRGTHCCSLHALSPSSLDTPPSQSVCFRGVLACLQTVQYIQPQHHAQLGQAELLVIDEAAAIPLPLVKSMLGPYLVFLCSTVNGYEGTGRSLSLKLLQQLRAEVRLAHLSGTGNAGSHCPVPAARTWDLEALLDGQTLMSSPGCWCQSRLSAPASKRSQPLSSSRSCPGLLPEMPGCTMPEEPNCCSMKC